MPHPFDRLHSVPDYEHLLDIVEEIDILEVFNPRVALDRLQRGGGALRRQVPDRPRRRLGQPRRPGTRQRDDPAHDFDGPEEFLEAMRDADIVRKHKNLVYVQALKLLQTSGGRGGEAACTAGKA